MSRTTISVTDEAAERLESVADRKDHESGTQFFHRIADDLEELRGATEDDVTDRNGLPENVFTTAHIDDIANEAASRTLRELEGTLR